MIDQRWHAYGAGEERDRFKYGYDRASNRVWKENVVSKNLATPAYLDEFYTYDGMHRLKSFDRGELDNPHSAILNPQSGEAWTLDALGNWSEYIQKTTGATDLIQDRVVNKANEITDITETTGTAWPTPTYDKNGNMTSMPQPGDLNNSYDCTWDAWNRLVKVEDATTVIAEYAYDGLMRRVTKTIDTAVRHFYYTARWQAIEERFDASANPDRQYIWGPLYIDHLVLRDRATSPPPAGVLEERIYALQTVNWDATCLIDPADANLERLVYDVYGNVSVCDPIFGIRDTSSFEWETRFTGRSADIETGLFDYRMRYYHAQSGFFTSRDAAIRLGKKSLYAYASSAPTNFIDPLGLLEIWSFSGVGNKEDDVFVSYVAEALAKIFPDHTNRIATEYVSRLGTNFGAYSLRQNVLILPVAKLDSEALEMAAGSLQSDDPVRCIRGVRKSCERGVAEGEFCGGTGRAKVHVIMLAPKVGSAGLPLKHEASCCDAKTTVFWNPWDPVVRGIQGAIVAVESSEYWQEWGDQHAVITLPDEGIFRVGQHQLDPFFGAEAQGTTIKEIKRMGRLKQLGIAPARILVPSGEKPTLLPENAIRSALAAEANDFVFVCHSQGCNIAMHVLNRACKKTQC